MFALKNDKQRFHFTIVGDGSQRKELEMRTLELGLNDSVTFVGKTSDIFGFMSKSQVFLMTSLYEGFGLVNLEAMDYGLPVIAPFTSTFPEILGRDHPLFFEPNNVVSCVEKLKELFGYSHSQIESLQERQRSQMNRFSEQKYLERHNEIYARVIDD
jgi:glycosyltransferase involved in cell wall biosynthesis